MPARFANIPKTFKISAKPAEPAPASTTETAPTSKFQTINESEFNQSKYGGSNLTDPFSGKPLLTYESEEQKSSLLLSDRTWAGFDPTKPQKIDPKMLQNGRMPKEVSQRIKSHFSGSASEELDHIMPLELGGSNDTSNLRLENFVPGTKNTLTDPEENRLKARAIRGEIAVVDAWEGIGKIKGIKLREESKSPTGADKGLPTIVQKTEEEVMSYLNDVGKQTIETIKNPIKAVQNIVDNSKKDADQLWQNLGDSAAAWRVARNPAEKVAAGASILHAIGSFALSPISETFNVASQIPGIRVVTDAMGIPFTLGGKIGETGVDALVSHLPIDKQSKEILRQPLDSLGSLLGQVVVGGVIYGKVSDLISKGEKITPEKAQEIVKETSVSEFESELSKFGYGKKEMSEISKIAEETPVPKESVGGVPKTEAETKTDKAMQRVLMEFEVSEAGRREFIKDDSGIIQEVRGVPSTFPNWVPQRLRSKDLFNQVSNLIQKGEEPRPKTKAAELYDLAFQQADSYREIDVKSLFGDEEGRTITDDLNRSSITLTSGFNPNLDKFIERDLKPFSKEAVKGLSTIWDLAKKTLNPTKRGKESEKAASILREELGKMARRKEMTYKSLEKARKVFDGWSDKKSLALIDAIETGRDISQEFPGSDQFVSMMREALSSRWKQIQAIKGTDSYIENYFPHLWKDAGMAENLARFFGKRPFEGTKSYLKQRTIPTIAEGIELGLEPLTTNPIDAIMARIVDMERFLMAHETWSRFKDEGLRKFVQLGERPNDGWKQVNDKIARSFQFSPEEKGMVFRGNWYMPGPAADVLNQYLSPGLRGNPLYDAFRMLGNGLNQVQLGISGFHALFTTADSVISKTALSIQKGKLLRAFVTPFTAPYDIVMNVYRGNKLLKDYYANNPQVPELVAALERAGGRVRMDRFYLNNSVENFMKALRSENYLGTLFRLPGALIEAQAKPLMQEFVPRQKLGVFSDGAKYILEQAQKEEWSEAKTTLRLQEFWDSVDNRLGQMVYDNLFWSKSLKDIGMLSVRSLGWNLGDIREIPGGLADYAALPFKALTKKGRLDIRMTPKMAYVIALPYVAGVWGAIIYYMYNGTAPQQLLDYYYPKTGRKKPDGTDERITLPTYMKDVFAVAAQPWQTVANKLHPEISAIIQMLENRDYYGVEIRNPNSNIMSQVAQVFDYQMKQFVPFSVTNALSRAKTGSSWEAYLQSFVGITPAPAYLTRTPMQSRIYNLYDKRFGGTTKSKEQSTDRQLKSQIRAAYWTGDNDKANQLLQQAIDQGIIKENGIPTFIRDLDYPQDVTLFRLLPSDDQRNIMRDMSLVDLQRYVWFAHKDVQESFSSISENAKQLVGLIRAGEAKEPVFKRGQIQP